MAMKENFISMAPDEESNAKSMMLLHTSNPK